MKKMDLVTMAMLNHIAVLDARQRRLVDLLIRARVIKQADLQIPMMERRRLLRQLQKSVEANFAILSEGEDNQGR